MATYIRSEDGKVQVEIEPGSPATMLPNISDQGLQAQIDALRTEIRTYRGQPVVVTDSTDMEDELTIYLYMGSEEGFNADHWYYYDGTEWVDGGEYVANPVLIDNTLTQSGEAADAKVTGDEITAIKADLSGKAPSSLFISDVDLTGKLISFVAPKETHAVITTESNAVLQTTSHNLIDTSWESLTSSAERKFGICKTLTSSGTYSSAIYGLSDNAINQQFPAGTYFFHLSCTSNATMDSYFRGYGKLEYTIGGTTHTCNANASFTANDSFTITRIYLSTPESFAGNTTYLYEAQIELGDSFTSYEVPDTIPVYTEVTESPMTLENFEGLNYIFGDAIITSLVTKAYVKNLIDDSSPSSITTFSGEKINNMLGVNLTDNPYYVDADTLSGDSVIRLVAPDVKRNYTISFFADIDTVGTLYIGSGKDAAFLGGYVSIDSTDIKVYTSESGTTVLKDTYAHGLSLVGQISVCIKATDLLKCDIILTSSGDATTEGGTYVAADAPWFGCYGFTYVATATAELEGRVTASTSGGVYENCRLSFYASEYKHDIWAFGDSYFDLWPKYAISDGFANVAIDGASGRNSMNAYRSLMIAVNKRKPKKILWCMGMNDIDNEDSVNTWWYGRYVAVKSYCENNNIELILSTIPCNNRNHYFKNQIIKASGLRYVDIAHAVGGEEIGSGWYSGLLGADGVHPTPLGSKVIATRFMADVPEMMEEKTAVAT